MSFLISLNLTHGYWVFIKWLSQFDKFYYVIPTISNKIPLNILIDPP
jgi:hypothetical protein